MRETDNYQLAYNLTTRRRRVSQSEVIMQETA